MGLVAGGREPTMSGTAPDCICTGGSWGTSARGHPSCRGLGSEGAPGQAHDLTCCTARGGRAGTQLRGFASSLQDSPGECGGSSGWLPPGWEPFARGIEGFPGYCGMMLSILGHAPPGCGATPRVGAGSPADAQVPAGLVRGLAASPGDKVGGPAGVSRAHGTTWAPVAGSRGFARRDSPVAPRAGGGTGTGDETPATCGSKGLHCVAPPSPESRNPLHGPRTRSLPCAGGARKASPRAVRGYSAETGCCRSGTPRLGSCEGCVRKGEQDASSAEGSLPSGSESGFMESSGSARSIPELALHGVPRSSRPDRCQVLLRARGYPAAGGRAAPGAVEGSPPGAQATAPRQSRPDVLPLGHCGGSCGSELGGGWAGRKVSDAVWGISTWVSPGGSLRSPVSFRRGGNSVGLLPCRAGPTCITLQGLGSTCTSTGVSNCHEEVSSRAPQSTVGVPGSHCQVGAPLWARGRPWLGNRRAAGLVPGLPGTHSLSRGALRPPRGPEAAPGGTVDTPGTASRSSGRVVPIVGLSRQGGKGRARGDRRSLGGEGVVRGGTEVPTLPSPELIHPQRGAWT